MAVGAQIDTSERETGGAKIPLLNGDQVHEATKVTGQYRYQVLTRGTAARTRVPRRTFKVNPRDRARCAPTRERYVMSDEDDAVLVSRPDEDVSWVVGTVSCFIIQLAEREAGLDRAREREREKERVSVRESARRVT